MRVYIFKRLVIAGVTLLGMSILIFVLMRLAPGNITDMIFESAGYVDEADRRKLEAELGIDKPVPVQYVRWLGEFLRGDLGKSYRYDLPAWEVIKPRLPVTLELAVIALGFSVLLGVPAGVISAVRRGRPVDYALRVFSLAGLSMPSFWLGMIVILLLVRSLGLIPSMTYVSPFENLGANLFQFLLPGLAVGYRSSALIMRITRSTMLEVLREDYIRTAWAKGQRETQVVWRHALKNASLPVVTLIGIEFAFLIGGLIVTETVFNLPGIARYLVDAIQVRDYPIVQNLVMLIAVVVVMANLTVDLLYTWLDPRIKYGEGLMAIRTLDVPIRDTLPEERGWGGTLWLFVKKNPLGAAGGLLMLLLILAAGLAEILATHNPIRTSSRVLVAPGAEFWLGTDNLGRDLWSRLVYGSRISLLVGVASTLLGAVTGGLVGLVSGYVGGKTDLVAQRLMDIMQALPILVLALVMAAALGPSLTNTIIAISVVIAPRAARVVRASVLAIREFIYIEAAHALGGSHGRVAFRHILPNTFGPFVVLVTAQLGGAILAEAALSFLGLGVPEPFPSWGRMLSIAAAEYATKAPWLVIYPGIAISLAVFGTNLLGDALRDTLDPRLRGS